MLLRNTLKAVGTYYFRRQLRVGSMQPLIIISHTRSGSSLLVHLLNSNPEIIGYGESQITYRNFEDYARAALRIHVYLRRPPRDARYVLDKVLHTRLLPDPKLLKHAITIFLLREPRGALTSMYRLNGQTERALSHYIDRIEWMLRGARALDPSTWFFLTYEDLTTDSEAALHNLTTFLALTKALTPVYRTTRATGAAGLGDPGPNIALGTISDNKPVNTIPESVLPLLARAEEAYLQAIQYFRPTKS